MISTIIASVLLFVIVALMLVRHERHFERLRRDLIITRRQLYDLQCDIWAMDSNIHILRKEIQELRNSIALKEMSNDVITSDDEHNTNQRTK